MTKGADMVIFRRETNVALTLACEASIQDMLYTYRELPALDRQDHIWGLGDKNPGIGIFTPTQLN